MLIYGGNKDMKKILVLLAGIILLCITLTSYAEVSLEAKFISSEEASEAVGDLAEVKNLQEKYHLKGYGFGMGVSSWPEEENPFYVIKVSADKEYEKAPKVYEAKQVFSKFFYVDAYSGKVVSQEEVEERVRAIKVIDTIYSELNKKMMSLPYKEYEAYVKEFMPEIIKKLDTCDPETKNKAAWIINQMQREAAQRDKEKILGKEIDRIRTELNQKRMSLPKEEYEKFVKESMPTILKGLDAITAEIKSNATQIVGQLAAWQFGQYKAEETVPKLIELLKDKDYGVRYQALFALGKIGDKKVVEFILPLLHDSDSLVRRGAIRSLTELGDSSLTPVLIKFLDDTSVHQEAVKALARIGDARAVEPLIKLFSNKDYFYLEQDIIFALGNIGDKRSIPFLIGLFNKKYTPDTKYDGHFDPGITHMGKDSADAIVKIGKVAIPYLTKALKSKEALMRLYSAYALGKMKDPISLGPLNKELMMEENHTVKICIRQAIAELKGEKFIPSEMKLKVWVESSKQEYKLSEPIDLFLYIQNEGQNLVIINTAPVFPGIFRITGPDGKPVHCLTEWKRTDFPTKDSLITLNPCQIHKAGPFFIQGHYSSTVTSPISTYYDFTLPGRYQIKGIYENRFNAIEFAVYAWVGKIESEPISIEVK